LQRKFPDENAKLTLDEAAFQRLLAAAFVIQEHNDVLQNQAPEPVEFKAADLSHIAETQNQIRSQKLGLLPAANLVLNRALKISYADAGALALPSPRELSYIYSVGAAAPSSGSTVPMDQSLSAECIRTSISVCIANLKNDQRLQSKVFQGRGLQGFASVPVRRDGDVKAVLELYFTTPKAVDQATLRGCELLAGLLSELVGQPPQQTPAPAPLASSPLEQLKAEFDRALEHESDGAGHPGSLAPSPEKSPAISAPVISTPPVLAPASVLSQTQPPIVRCANCGCPLEPEESFCGLCGTSRTTQGPAAAKPPAPRNAAADIAPSESNVKHVRGSASIPAEAKDVIPPKTEVLPPELQEILARFPEEPPIVPDGPAPKNSVSPPVPIVASPAPLQAQAQKASLPAAAAATQPVAETLAPKKDAPAAPATASQTSALPPAEVATPPEQPGQWKSAAETRAWLESVKADQPAKHWLAAQRANLYLAVAALLLVLVLFGVGVPNRPSNPQKPQLGWFDSMLVSLGIAEAPTPPVYQGNPNVKVWVDLHTALYYCSDADLYGKTHGGKFETQRQAQEEQFEPASRQACP
jgi:hypothetical protein